MSHWYIYYPSKQLFFLQAWKNSGKSQLAREAEGDGRGRHCRGHIGETSGGCERIGACGHAWSVSRGKDKYGGSLNWHCSSRFGRLCGWCLLLLREDRQGEFSAWMQIVIRLRSDKAPQISVLGDCF